MGRRARPATTADPTARGAGISTQNPNAGVADWNSLEFVPLEGVTVEPGEFRRLLVTFRWSDMGCMDGSGYASRAVTLRYGAFGVFRREQVVAPPSEVVLVCGPLPRPNGDLITRGYTGPRAP